MNADELVITSIATLRPEPGDVIVLKVSTRLGSEALSQLYDAWARASAGTALENLRVIILHEGMDIEFIDVSKLQEANAKPIETDG